MHSTCGASCGCCTDCTSVPEKLRISAFDHCLQGSLCLNDVNSFGCAELSGNLLLMQGQDESDETRHTLESCNAIGGAIEFTSVSIDPIKVLIMRLRLLLQIHHGSQPKVGLLGKLLRPCICTSIYVLMLECSLAHSS